MIILSNNTLKSENIAFSHLSKSVIAPGLCVQCGMCVSVCPVAVIDLPKETPILTGECIECGFCYKACPQIYKDRPKVEKMIFGKKSAPDDPYGVVIDVFSVRMKDSALRAKCQDGGATTAITTALLEKGLVDGVILSGRGSEPLSTRPIVTTSVKEIEKATGTRYCPSPNLVKYPEAVRQMKLEKLCYVGLPCHLLGFRRAQLIPVRLYEKRTEVLIGIFCMENFHYTKIIQEVLTDRLKIDPSKVGKVNMKSNFIVSLKGKADPLEVPIRELDPYVLKGCSLCEDLTSEMADISIGAIGSEQGWNTVIIRNSKGKALFDAIKDRLEVKPLPPKYAKTLDICAKRKRRQAYANRKAQEQTRRLPLENLE